jgi:hypothetical protein
MSGEKFVTLSEAAEAIGVRPVTIRRRIERIGLTLQRNPLDRRRWLVAVADLPALAAADVAIERMESAA